MLNIYEQIDANKRRSALIIALFTIFILAVGYSLSYVYGYDWSFLVFAIFFSSIGSLVSFYYSDQIALSLSGAKQASTASHRTYLNIVDNLARVARIPTPRAYVIASPALNAIATGRDPAHGAIAVTQGLLDRLDRSELEGVIAHELSHIRNYDTRLMTIVTILVGSIALILNYSWRLSALGGRSRDSDRGGGNAIIMLVGIVLIILAPIIAELIKLAISRRREFYADAAGVMLTRQPSGLIGALRKIASHEDISLETASPATAHMFLDNPLTKENEGEWLSKLFSTHPPIKERIRALEGQA